MTSERILVLQGAIIKSIIPMIICWDTLKDQILTLTMLISLIMRVYIYQDAFQIGDQNFPPKSSNILNHNDALKHISDHNILPSFDYMIGHVEEANSQEAFISSLSSSKNQSIPFPSNLSFNNDILQDILQGLSVVHNADLKTNPKVDNTQDQENLVQALSFPPSPSISTQNLVSSCWNPKTNQGLSIHIPPSTQSPCQEHIPKHNEGCSEISQDHDSINSKYYYQIMSIFQYVN